jgi:hypothetical protein
VHFLACSRGWLFRLRRGGDDVLGDIPQGSGSQWGLLRRALVLTQQVEQGVWWQCDALLSRIMQQLILIQQHITDNKIINVSLAI